MVRFKNRHLLVEFLSPQSLSPTVTISNAAGSNALEEMQLNGNADADDGDGEAEDDDEDDGLPLLPTVPFLVPSIGEHERLKLGDESGSTIYRAIKQSLLDVFGDEGWGRVSSSFKGVHSFQSTSRPAPINTTGPSYMFPCSPYLLRIANPISNLPLPPDNTHHPPRLPTALPHPLGRPHPPPLD